MLCGSLMVRVLTANCEVLGSNLGQGRNLDRDF